MVSRDAPNTTLWVDPISAAMGSKLSGATIDPGLHIVATPIGNLADITIRALAVLARANVIACEDTRVTGKLKSAYGLTSKLTSYHDHNSSKVLPLLIQRLKEGQIVALVSDAGTPLISDPGYRLIRAAIGEGLAVFSIPGPTAALAALVGSGLPTDRFYFCGFLPVKTAARLNAIKELGIVHATLIFYESAKRLGATLNDLNEVLGKRDAVVARELTKRNEVVKRGTLKTLAKHFSGQLPPKGEIVILVGASKEKSVATDEEIEISLNVALQTLGVRDAAKLVASETGRSKRDVYQRALLLQGEEINTTRDKN